MRPTARVFQVEAPVPFRRMLVGVLMFQTRLERGFSHSEDQPNRVRNFCKALLIALSAWQPSGPCVAN